MPSSTKIRSNADISKTGKMRVLQHGKHKVTTKPVAASEDSVMTNFIPAFHPNIRLDDLDNTQQNIQLVGTPTRTSITIEPKLFTAVGLGIAFVSNDGNLFNNKTNEEVWNITFNSPVSTNQNFGTDPSVLSLSEFVDYNAITNSDFSGTLYVYCIHVDIANGLSYFQTGYPEGTNVYSSKLEVTIDDIVTAVRVFDEGYSEIQIDKSPGIVVTKYIIFVSQIDNLFTNVTDMTSKIGTLQLSISTGSISTGSNFEFAYSESESDGPDAVKLKGSHFIDDNYNHAYTSIQDNGPYYVYVIQKIDTLSHFSKIDIPTYSSDFDPLTRTVNSQPGATYTWP